MATSISLRSLIVIALAIVMVITGIVLLGNLSKLRDALPDYPIPEDEIHAEVFPASSQEGTLFLIKAVYPVDREQQDLILMIKKGNNVGSVYLFDDGKHYDNGVNDGVYVGFFDSLGKQEGVYDIMNKKDVLASFEISNDKCEIIVGNSNDDNINFVVLPSGYDDYEEFKSDAKRLIAGGNSLLYVEPFKSNQDKFSFSTVETNQDLGCEIGCHGIETLVCCDNEIVKQEASKCHHDNVFVLINSNKLCGSASSYAKVCAKHEDAKLILMHELGHTFAGLADEYVYSDYYGNYSIGKISKPNCDSEGCLKWNNITDSCFEGCTYSTLYRSSEKNSIMYDLYPEFNQVSALHIEKLIQNYIKIEKEVEESIPVKKSYFIGLDYKNENIEIDEIILKPIKSEIGYKESDYKAEISNENGGVVFETNVFVPNELLPIPGTFSRPVIENQVHFYFMLPYFRESKTLIIYKGDKPIARESLAFFSEVCGNNVCELTETHFTCPDDCSISDDFCETNPCDPDCPGQEKCEISRKTRQGLFIGLIIGALLLIIIAIIRVKKSDKFKD